MNRFVLGLIVGIAAGASVVALFHHRDTGGEIAAGFIQSEDLEEAWEAGDFDAMECQTRSHLLYEEARPAMTHALMCAKLLEDRNNDEGQWDIWPEVALSE